MRAAFYKGTRQACRVSTAAHCAGLIAARNAANFSTFPHAGKAIACDQLSRSDIDGTNGFVSLYGALPPDWPGGWKAVDNTYVPISSVADWEAFTAACSQPEMPILPRRKL